jgi:hypothetical protein
VARADAAGTRFCVTDPRGSAHVQQRPTGPEPRARARASLANWIARLGGSRARRTSGLPNSCIWLAFTKRSLLLEVRGAKAAVAADPVRAQLAAGDEPVDRALAHPEVGRHGALREERRRGKHLLLTRHPQARGRTWFVRAEHADDLGGTRTGVVRTGPARARFGHRLVTVFR